MKDIPHGGYRPDGNAGGAGFIDSRPLAFTPAPVSQASSAGEITTFSPAPQTQLNRIGFTPTRAETQRRGSFNAAPSHHAGSNPAAGEVHGNPVLATGSPSIPSGGQIDNPSPARVEAPSGNVLSDGRSERDTQREPGARVRGDRARIATASSPGDPGQLDDGGDSRRYFDRARQFTSKANLDGDGGLVHGDVSKASIGQPVAEEGVYSQRFITEDTTVEAIEQIAKETSIIVVSCMDKRVVAPLIDEISTRTQTRVEQITVISIAGGPIQPGRKDAEMYADQPDTALTNRKGALTNTVRTLLVTKDSLRSQGQTPEPLQGIYLIAHTSGLTGRDDDAPCGGNKAFCGGTPIGDAISPDKLAQLKVTYNTDSAELAATQGALAFSSASLLEKLAKTRVVSLDELLAMTTTAVVSPIIDDGKTKLQWAHVNPNANAERLAELVNH